MTLKSRQSSRYPQGFYEKKTDPVNKFDPGVNLHNQSSVKLEAGFATWIHKIQFISY